MYKLSSTKRWYSEVLVYKYSSNLSVLPLGTTPDITTTVQKLLTYVVTVQVYIEKGEIVLVQVLNL
jgi:hypothetical protein